MSNFQPLLVLLPVLYLASALLHGLAFGVEVGPRIERARLWMLRFALLAHVGMFGLRWNAHDGFPITDAWTTVSAVALCVAALHAGIARRLGHPGATGIVLGCVFLLQLAASMFGHVTTSPPETTPTGFRVLHVSTSVLAASALVVSGIHGALYLTLYRQMREKHFGPLFQQLPDLSVLAVLTRRAALAGFLFLTVGLNVGIWWAHARGVKGFAYADPSVLLTIALWIHFGVIAFSRHIRGFTARYASWAAAAGLVALLLTIAVSLLPSVTFHDLR